MPDSSPPRRLRHSFEARCRLVQLVHDGLSPAQAGIVCGISRASAYRLVRRQAAGGWAALRDRSSAPRRPAGKLDDEAEQQIIALRRATGLPPRLLAAALDRPASTIWRVLHRHNLSRAPAAPLPPPNRYEYPHPGALVHLDTKRLGRFWQTGKRIIGDGVQRNPGAGWQHAHVAIDDHSRVVISELYPSEDATTCSAFLELVVARFAELGVRIERVMTDNGSGYRSRAFRAALARHRIRHLRTRPYTPRTNGKAEAFIRTLQREWAYAYAYASSAERARALPGYIRWYNKQRPHSALKGRPPISRVSQAAGSYT